MGPKVVPPLGNIPMQGEPPPGYRGRYDGLPPFEDVPPGVEPPVPGFEPSPFEKPPFGAAGPMDRERGPPPNYREPYRPPFVEGPGPGYRDMPIPSVQNEIPVHVGDQPPRYRDNYRPGHQFRDQGPMPFREGQPYRDSGPSLPYRDGPPGPAREFRGGPAGQFRDNSYRNNHPFRDGNFRDNPPHNFRDSGPPFRPPSADPRDPVPPNYHDPNYRDGFRDDNNREILRPGFRSAPSTHGRGGSRRNPNIEHERPRDRGRERERFNDNRDVSERHERSRDDKRPGYEKSREGREDRPRDYEKYREYEKERERDYDRNTPDKKVRSSPKRSRDGRDKKRSESRGRSRERDRDIKREKKEERIRDKSSADGTKEHKEKEKKEKIKERKKKKREKDTEKEKKKKRDRKDKKDKDFLKKDDENTEKTEEKVDEKENVTQQPKQHDTANIEKKEIEPAMLHEKEESPKFESDEQPKDVLYGDEADEAIDKEIIQNYVKTEENDAIDDQKNMEYSAKDEPFDGIELQANADELDLKADFESTPQVKEMLANLPELSKWEVEDDNMEKLKEPGEITSPEEEEDSGKVTSEVLKRAENAIFAKAINSLRPIEIKKISSDRAKLYSDEPSSKSSIQITVPLSETETRAVEVNDKKRRYSKTPPPRLSVKERLGGKVEDIRRPREPRVVHSTVERVKSRSKTPKKEQPYRRVTLEKDRSRKIDDINRQENPKSERRIASEAVKLEKHGIRNTSKDVKKKETEKFSKPEKIHHEEILERLRGDKSIKDDNHTSTDRERKKSTLDEAHFEPDYDENVESENETKDDTLKKRNRSRSPVGPTEPKKVKLDKENDTIKLDLTNVKKKPESESESSSSDASSSSSSSDARKRKKKKKRAKKKRKRAASDSESESDSSSDDHKKKKKKRKHKKKSSKKKKKSKHK